MKRWMWTTLWLYVIGCDPGEPLGPLTARRSAVTCGEGTYRVGAGRADITGPLVQVSTGYNAPGEVAEGLGMRLYSRAFVVESPCDGSRVALVTAEMVHLYESIKPGVLAELRALGLGEVYTDQNLLLSATHAHAAPSNLSWYTLFNLANGTVGFDRLHYRLVVSGIARSIQQAHQDLKPATIKLVRGEVQGAAFNRSPWAHGNNLDGEGIEGVNRQMVLLRFDGLDGQEIGLINWFGLHGTSLGIKNHLVHGDNKGYAAYQTERARGGGFVAAFAQAEMGDVSPNQPDPNPENRYFLRANDRDRRLSEIENPIVDGQKQWLAAQALLAQEGETLRGALAYRHSFVDFNRIERIEPRYVRPHAMPWDEPEQARTGVACVGAGFLAGDEEGAPVDFAREGEMKNAFVLEDGRYRKVPYRFENTASLVRALGALWPIAKLVLGTDAYAEVHKEKVVLLPVGQVERFWPFNPGIPFVETITPLQLVVLGQLAIAAVPFEVTTMEARRIKDRLATALAPAGISEVVLATMANSYSMYLTTREEYAEQHFEGAFTLFGPWSGAATEQELDRLAQDFLAGRDPAPGPNPPDLSAKQLVETWVSRTGVIRDGGNFGEVLTDARERYVRDETVQVVFRGAHPRTVFQRLADASAGNAAGQGAPTFLEVQRRGEDGAYQTVADDGDPLTTLRWKRVGGPVSPLSEVTIQWILRDVPPGTYRILYHGLAKRLLASDLPFTGTSRPFEVADR